MEDRRIVIKCIVVFIEKRESVADEKDIRRYGRGKRSSGRKRGGKLMRRGRIVN